MRQKIIFGLVIVGLALLIRNLNIILLGFPDEAAQGAIYRIIFFHVPCWFICFTAFALAGLSSGMYLWKKQTIYDDFAVSAVEIGTVFTAAGLATGSIWARIIWGIWWTWDPRLTWAFICLLVYLGYLMLRRAIDDPTERAKNSAVLCLFAFTSVVITYKAIDWWRTQHPGAILSFRTGGGNIESSWEHMLLWNFLAMGLISIAVVMIRMRQERMQREIDALRRRTHEL
jgi:heme exporter protein C